MFKYIVVQLADNAISYCHYNNVSSDTSLISKEILKKAIRFAMLENLHVTFVYPDRVLPIDYSSIINTVEHVKIVPINYPDISDNDIVVCDSIDKLNYKNISNKQIVVLRIFKSEIFQLPYIYETLCKKIARLNIVVKDIEYSDKKTWSDYKIILQKIGQLIIDDIDNNCQINILSDRLQLIAMNNCNAGDESITLMPNGRFYPCPAFFYDNPNEYFGDLEEGIQIKNEQLFRLDHAPICSHCDAYQCRRCVWLNRKTTLEINTPSKEQCIWSHLERNASGEILKKINNVKANDLFQHISIPDINYLDPFENKNNWK